MTSPILSTPQSRILIAIFIVNAKLQATNHGNPVLDLLSKVGRMVRRLIHHWKAHAKRLTWAKFHCHPALTLLTLLTVYT